ncbi:MAG: hypothetical protein H6R00_948 [Proteobacteria bacterium]|jgi:hypothetical protein|nr:hypothetical protein [Pseudomonadota bacterium]
MNTLFLLMAQYNAAVIIPLDKVRADFFPHLTMPKLLRKVMAGEIDLPVTRIEGSQKAAKGVHISDLAEYLDKRRAAAIRERDALCG